MFTQWNSFKGRTWKMEINVRDFIQSNYTQYEGDASFLSGATEATNKLWTEVSELLKERENGGILDLDTKTISKIDAYNPGYIDKISKKLLVFKLMPH